jgi:poly(3-hydroxybutyrate) depolymerase
MRFPRVLLAAALAATGLAHGAAPLGQYNIDTGKISVSGLSSGGFMANQLGVAYSSTFMGVGIFAAGPYNCAGLNNYTACMYNASISASQLGAMQASIDSYSSSGAIDPKSNIANQKIFIFVGTSDYTVGPNPTDALQTQYLNNGVPAGSISYVKRSGAAHVLPTDFDSTGNNACASSTSPYISNCGYDGAGAVLTQIYGALSPRNNAPAAANYIEFDQTPYTAGNPGMASTGWLYVPASCASGTQCKLHVVLHGCQQSTDKIGDKFVRNTGFSRWADTNNMVLLFPQTKVDNNTHPTTKSVSLANANACWDWIGWYGNNFAQKSGTQMAAIKAMVDRIASGAGSGDGGGGTTPPTDPVLPAPTGLSLSGATATSMDLSWGAVAGASGYNVYRNGNKANALMVYSTRYTDAALAASTTYSWAVRAVNANGVEGEASAAVSGTTLAGSVPAGTCATASNYAHTQAGRAYQQGGYAWANGSGQNMGLWNVFVTTTLKQTSPNYYVIGTCP